MMSGMTNAKPLTLLELRELARDSASVATFSPLSEKKWVLFDARSKRLSAADGRAVADWLGRLACPTLGIFPLRSSDPLRKACDVVLDDEAGATSLLRNIGANPITAGILVQLLRATEKMDVPQALVCESLAYSTLQSGPEFQRWLAQRPASAPPSADTGPAVEVERTGAKLTIKLNRPSNRNALSVEMRDALNEAFQLAVNDATIRRIQLSGRGKCFSVGGDLAEFGSLPDPATGHAVRSLTMPGHLLALVAKRVHAHVHGACIGSGVELPAFARLISAAADTYFHLPELRLGLIPGGGGCVSIPRRIGRHRTAAWILSGKRINAKRALEWGLIDEIIA